MKIRCGINRKLPSVPGSKKRKPIEHRNGKIEVPDTISESGIREAIMCANPGWSITGYVKVNDRQEWLSKEYGGLLDADTLVGDLDRRLHLDATGAETTDDLLDIYAGNALLLRIRMHMTNHRANVASKLR